ncbi:glycosyl transferase [Synergistales bacterium]|nr:glycosyl transferase [Synergistales bacterium]
MKTKESLIEIAVLIPCYNEEATIAKVVADCLKALPQAVIYVYDNNSTDRSREITEGFRVGKYGQEHVVVRSEKRQGKGWVVRSMLRDIHAKCYLMLDADDTYSVEHAASMCDLVLNGNADMVVGDRLSSTYFKENKRRFHGGGNRLVRRLVNTFFNTNIRDVMTGYRAMSYRFAKTFPALASGFTIETEMTVHAADKGLNIENVIVDYRDRPEGSVSKLNTISDGVSVLKAILKLYKNYRPLSFFGTIAAILLLAAIVLFLPVLATYVRTGLVPKFPTLIISGFLAISAIQAFFGGLILDTIAENHRANFEIELNKATMESE